MLHTPNVERLATYAGIPVLLASENADFGAFTPSIVTGLAEPVDGNPIAVVRHNIGDHFSVARDSNGDILLEGPPDLCNALFFLGEVAAEGYRQAHDGGAMVHAGAVADSEGRGLLILGEKGGGKTTSSIRMCREQGGQLIGNDQIILGRDSLGGIMLLDGNKELDVRRSAALADEWLGKAVTVEPKGEAAHWDNKRSVLASELGIRVASGPHLARAVVKVLIDRTQDNSYATKKQGGDLLTVLFLAERLSRLIRGTSTPIITDGNVLLGFSPDMDTPAAEAQRVDLIKQMFAEDIGFWNIYAHDSEGAVALMNQALHHE